MIVIKNRAEETERIEEEIDGYREDIDKMLDAFKTREKELIEEIDNVHQRNEVLTNLLDLVTERADSTAKQLEKYHAELSSHRSGSSAVSAASDVSTGSDDVFVSSQNELSADKKVFDQNWEVRGGWSDFSVLFFSFPMLRQLKTHTSFLITIYHDIIFNVLVLAEWDWNVNTRQSSDLPSSYAYIILQNCVIFYFCVCINI